MSHHRHLTLDLLTPNPSSPTKRATVASQCGRLEHSCWQGFQNPFFLSSFKGSLEQKSLNATRGHISNTSCSLASTGYMRDSPPSDWCILSKAWSPHGGTWPWCGVTPPPLWWSGWPAATGTTRPASHGTACRWGAPSCLLRGTRTVSTAALPQWQGIRSLSTKGQQVLLTNFCVFWPPALVVDGNGKTVNVWWDVTEK